MKFLVVLLLIACASKNEGIQKEAPSTVTNEAFKKEKPLKNSDVQDFYSNNPAGTNPALIDETLDRYTIDELTQMGDGNDPLQEISIRCSKRDFDRAFQVASKSFDKYQKVAAYWNQVANCHLNQGSFRKALLFYNKALEIAPNYVPALNNIGVMYSRQNLDQKAQIAFERASKYSKFAKTPRYNLAKLYLRFGLAEQALPVFQGLLSSSPQDVDLLNAVASSYFLMSDYQSALKHFSRIPAEHFRLPEIGLNYAITLLKLNRPAEARSVYESVRAPQTAALKQYHASLSKLLGDKE